MDDALVVVCWSCRCCKSSLLLSVGDEKANCRCRWGGIGMRGRNRGYDGQLIGFSRLVEEADRGWQSRERRNGGKQMQASCPNKHDRQRHKRKAADCQGNRGGLFSPFGRGSLVFVEALCRMQIQTVQRLRARTKKANNHSQDSIQNWFNQSG